uniref:RIN4 pathogenic type III effector avirulence factor Avr cleavage site domain-containing protein n=2 Tax=Davidia involucrata TaxID=16924 RepID=A0A5B7A132_DAVIN
MAQRSQVPKFGNWESEENVPYTAYFDSTRKSKSGGKMNPNDCQDNPNMFSNNMSPVRAPPLQQDAELKDKKGPEAVSSKHENCASREDGEFRRLSDSRLHPDTVGHRDAIDSSYQRHGGVRSGSSKSESEAPKGPVVLRPRHERQLSQEDGELRQTDSPLHHDTVHRRATLDSPHHRHGGISTGDNPKRASRKSVGSDRSIEHSPLHPHYQARVGGKGSGVSSPSWERKASEGGHGLSPSTPGRSRLRSVNRGDETPDHSPAVPKFGDWDEGDPASSEGYSHIFNRVREERQSGDGKVPVMATETSYSNGQKQYGNVNSKSCCCFPWGRK